MESHGRTRPSRSREAGAKVAATPAEVATASEAVITMLTDGAAIDAVYNGPNGLLSGDVKGKLFIEMSTVRAQGRDRSRAQGARQGRRDGRMPGRRLDRAGAQGPVARADGRRARRCGARQADPRAALPQGRALRAGRHRRGDQALDQPAADGRLAGLRRGLCHRAQRRLGAKRLLDLFVESNGANKAIGMRADMIVKMLERKDPGPTTFSIANAVKDLRTMIATGKSLGADMIATKAALAGFEDAIAHGLGGEDGSRMTVYWSERKKK